MADATITPTGNGGAIPALYREYLAALERYMLGDDPQAEIDMGAALEAISDGEGETLADLVAITEACAALSGRDLRNPVGTEDRLFAAQYRCVYRLANRTIGRSELFDNQAQAMEILQAHYRLGGGKPIHLRDWYGAYAAGRKEADGSKVKRWHFEHTVRALIRKNYVQELTWNHFRPLE